MYVTVRVAGAALVAALMTVAVSDIPGTSAQGTTASTEPLHFHHVHLNSMDPAAAAAYYPKPFAQTAVKTTFNGFEAVKTGNIYILVYEGQHAAPERADRSADVGLALRVEHTELASVRRKVPGDGPSDRADVGRR